MASAALREQLASVLGTPLEWQDQPLPEVLNTGISEVDSLAGGLPRGALTEVCGPASSGRTSLLYAVMGQVVAREEVCALVDTDDRFDPASAAAAGVDLARVLWVRCGGNAEHALKVTDLLVQGGGFGLVVLDLGDTPLSSARRISLTSWFRLRRAVEHTPTVLLALEPEPLAKTCASLVLELRRDRVLWSGAPGCSRLLRGLRVAAERRKPVRAARAWFEARIWG